MKLSLTHFTLLTLFIAGCTSSKVQPSSQADVDRVKDKFPNYTVAELNQGKTLYEENCGSCHGLKKPASYNETEWKQIVPKMTKLVNKTEVKLDEKKEELILRYLITMSTSSGK